MKTTNSAFLIDPLTRFRGSIFHFYQKGGIAYYAIVNHKIIGISYSGYIGNNYVTIGIETTYEYRKMGVGYSPGCEVINNILNSNYKACRDCEKENIASMGLARKLGFQELIEYNCYGFGV